MTTSALQATARRLARKTRISCGSRPCGGVRVQARNRVCERARGGERARARACYRHQHRTVSPRRREPAGVCERRGGRGSPRPHAARCAPFECRGRGAARRQPPRAPRLRLHYRWEPQAAPGPQAPARPSGPAAPRRGSPLGETGKTVPGENLLKPCQLHCPWDSAPRIITQRSQRQFTSGLMSVKDQEESFCTHQSACELSLWSLSYRSSKIDAGKQGWGGTVPGTAIHPAISSSATVFWMRACGQEEPHQSDPYEELKSMRPGGTAQK